MMTRSPLIFNPITENGGVRLKSGEFRYRAFRGFGHKGEENERKNI